MRMYFIEVTKPWMPAEYLEVSDLGRIYANNGRRNYRIGVSAFECLHVANFRRRQRLEMFVASGYNVRHRLSEWLVARQVLSEMRNATS